MFGSLNEQRRVEKLIQQQECCSTRYVRQQYRYTFLRAAILLYNILSETKNLENTLRALDKYWALGKYPVTKGMGVKARQVLALLLRYDTDVDDKLSVLESWIECELIERFDEGVVISDDTGCCICDPEPIRDDNGVYSLRARCTQHEPRPCTIEEFWQARQQELQGQASFDLSSLPKEQNNANIQRMQSASQEVLSGKKKPRGQRCYVALSDSVIVCESVAGSILATTNLRDFIPIVRMVGGDREVLDPFQEFSE